MSVRFCSLLVLSILFASVGSLDADEPAEGKFDSKRLIGKWTYESGQKNGEKLAKDHFTGQVVAITNKTFTLEGEQEFVMDYEIMDTEKPTGIKLTMTKSPFGAGATTTGILELSGDQLKFCYAAMGGAAPTKFEAKDESGHHFFILKRFPEKLTKKALIGTWSFASGKKDGEALGADRFAGQSVEITKDLLVLKGEETFEMKYELDASKEPTAIHLTISKGPFGEGSRAKGIVKLGNDELSICYNPMDGDAPKSFDAKSGSGHFLFQLKRSEKN